MTQQTVEVSCLMKAWGCGERRPDSDFNGLMHGIGFDWTDFHNDFDAFLDRFKSLFGQVPFQQVMTVLEQIMWRVADSTAQMESFLRAVFGEVRHA
ncbi:hypothetical protein D3C75_990710 [compost metagenome]